MQYVYLSYAPDDQDFALRLVDDLQTAGYMVFMDAVNEPGSMAWAAEARRAIRGCGAVIMLLSAAGRRRTGIRLEGIGAKRRNKPVIVVRRSAGELPRYMQDATILDGMGDYAALWDGLRAALPDPLTLMKAAAPNLRPPQRPPRQPQDSLARRRMVIGALLVALLVIMLVVAGVMPV